MNVLMYDPTAGEASLLGTLERALGIKFTHLDAPGRQELVEKGVRDVESKIRSEFSVSKRKANLKKTFLASHDMQNMQGAIHCHRIFYVGFLHLDSNLAQVCRPFCHCCIFRFWKEITRRDGPRCPSRSNCSLVGLGSDTPR